MYKADAPIDIPSAKKNSPSHFPKINPAKIANGEAKPAANIQIIVNKINKTDNRNKFDSLSLKK